MLINNILLSLYSRRFKEIDYFCEHPTEVQAEVLRDLLKAAQHTQYGKQFDFSTISGIDIFQQRLPILDYDDIKPYINKIRQGEKNVLWPGNISWFSKSSGTTSDKSKFIPVSKESLHKCHYRGSKDVLLTYIRNHPETGILRGKSITLGGSQQIDDYNVTARSGDLSAILIHNIPFYTHFNRLPKRKTALIPDFEEKLKRIAKETIHANVTSFAGVPSWNLVMMKYILEHTGKSNLLELWPNLSLFIHGGIGFAPYREQFEAIIPSPDMHYMETYNASEGFFALQNDLGDSSMLLMMDLGIFYEFIPIGELNSAHPNVHTVADVKTGESYAMLITTNSGLWRYLIGDTVEFTSLYPHKLKITGRTKHFINVFGEELMVYNAEKALATACEKTNALVKDYTVAPIFMSGDEKGAHEWLVEFEKTPQDMDVFADILDNALCAINSDYEAKRAKSVTLNRLKLTPLPEGTFYRWMKKRGKLGGQNKVPRLYNTRQYADELLNILNEKNETHRTQ